MNKFLTIKNLLIASGIMVIILITFYLYGVLSPRLPTLISSTPIVNSTNNNVVSPILLKFDVSIDSRNFVISSVPEENWNVSQTDTQTLSLGHSQYLKSNTSYLINIIYKTKPLTSLAFITAGGQADPRYYQQVQADLSSKYPLATYTPYDTPLYRVVYSAPMTLEITLKSPTISRAQAISDIKSWVTSIGGDASSHQYVIAKP